MRAKDQVAKRTLMMVRAAIQLTEKERREELDDAALLGIFQKEVKSRQETISEAKTAGREDLIADTAAEILILKKYLPQEMSSEDLHTLAAEVIAETEASTIRDMGKVMKLLIPRVEGRASGGDISKTVRDLLQN
ncbi:MAG: GatB/YqeY domain-containing protein [Anaerolineae bacterium]|nr:GatB/YqeY domain-containing protein [Anaerolineae bacterium]MBT7783729.1 GatB/YqeY domain-containing protein [Anaerolineae bacterium]